MVRRAIEPIKTDFKQSFAMMIVNSGLGSSKRIGSSLRYQKILINASLKEGKKEIINLMLRNNIPDADTAEFRIYIDDNFSVVESAILSYLGEQWDTEILLISYNKRYESYQNHRAHLKRAFSEMMTEARSIVIKEKKKKNEKKK